MSNLVSYEHLKHIAAVLHIQPSYVNIRRIRRIEIKQDHVARKGLRCKDL